MPAKGIKARDCGTIGILASFLPVTKAGSLSGMEVKSFFTVVFDGFTCRTRTYKREERPRQYRNALAVAKEWRALMSESSLTQADLARKLRVSRARVTQVLRLLDLDPKVAATIVALGDPLPRQVITERALRPFIDLPLDQQRPRVAQLIRRAKEQLRLAAKKDSADRASEPG